MFRQNRKRKEQRVKEPKFYGIYRQELSQIGLNQLLRQFNSININLGKEIMAQTVIHKKRMSFVQFLPGDLAQSQTFGKPPIQLENLNMLSKKNIPFSAQIFQNSSGKYIQSSDTMNFHSEKLTLRCQDGYDLNEETSKSCQLNRNNPFLKARMNYEFKVLAQKQASRSKETGDQDLDHIFEESDIVTFRILKKRSLNQNSQILNCK